MGSTGGTERVVSPSRPVPLGAVVGIFRRGGGDPTSRRDDGGWWFAWRTPDGPVTLRLTAAPSAGEVTASAWGSGAAWVLERVPDLLGERDDPAAFVAHHPLVAQAWRRFPGWRVPRSGLVVQALVPHDHRAEGHRQGGLRGLPPPGAPLRRAGAGPGEDLGLVVPPDPRGWAAVPSWEWLAAGVDPGRSRTVVRAVGHAGRLEECADLPAEAARARLTALPGVGRWTWAEVAQRALGAARRGELR